MASVATSFRRLFLREAKWSAEAAGVTLFDKLKGLARSYAQATMSGNGDISSTSANGQSVAFSSSNVRRLAGMMTQQDAAELVSQMLDLYDKAVEEDGRDNLAGLYDDDVFDIMMTYLEPVQELSNDFSQYIPQ